ncbi:MAG TPA: ABC transporter permease [Chthoniobacterales bacterium]|nr:ABC transporter permease [Chthoniobacterales bacterium]
MPDFKEIIRERLRSLGLAPARENEIAEELSQHLEDQYEQALSRGATEDEAREDVLIEFNQTDVLARSLKGVEPRVPQNPIPMGTERKRNMFADLSQDVRYGARMLLKNPGFTIIAVFALALGIGANSAIFSVVNALLLRPLPYKNPSQLVVIWENAAHLGFPKNTPSPANFLDWQRQGTVFEGMGAFAERSFNLTGVGEPERLDGRRVSANLFDLLGVKPILGRTFVPEEDKPGTKVALLNESLWKRRFGSDPGVVGRALALNGESYTVIGVLPSSVRLPAFGNWRDQVWVPLAFPADEAAARGNHFLEVIARMKPGVSLEQARAEMQTIAARLAQQYPEDNTRIGSVVNPLHEEIVGNMKPALLILLGAVAFVLLIACANVANLLLARAAARHKEIALRLALGADRRRLTKQLLVESVMLSLLGSAVGLALAYAGLRVLTRFIPADVAHAELITIDGKVMLFTLIVAVVTGLVFGLAPASQATHFNINDTLKEGGRDSGAGPRGKRLRSALVIAEVAVSFILLIGAGLLINSFMHLRNLDPGFRADHLLALNVDLSETKYPDTPRRVAFFDEVVRRIQALPGVRSVAVAGNLPFTYNGDSMPIGVEGVPDPPPDQHPDVVFRAVGPGYFSTMGIPLVRGRDFTEQDKLETDLTVVVSEKTAKFYWPNSDPIGKRIKNGSTTSEAPWRTVIGVVKDVRQNDFVAEPKMQMYFTYRQLRSLMPNALIVRTAVEPLSLATSVRNAIWAVDKDQTVANVTSMEKIVASAVARQRFSMLLLAIFAGVALVLAAVGIYGVMSYSVAQQTREIGIRMALGAQRGDVLRMTVQQGLKLVGFGLVIGLVAAFILTRVMASLLFGISATDPITFLSISLVLVAVALLANLIPALRATKVDPMIALRAQ